MLAKEEVHQVLRILEVSFRELGLADFSIILIENHLCMIIKTDCQVESHSHVGGVEHYQLFQNLL